MAELEASARDYEWADARFEAIGRDLLGALAPHAGWTSAATHPVLPLLATDAAIELQVATGIVVPPPPLRRMGRGLLAARVRSR